MKREKVATMKFERVYLSYLQKVIRKGRTKEELDKVIFQLTGYQTEGWSSDCSMQEFFENAPKISDKIYSITGSICGIKIAEIEDSFLRKVRCLDKVVDEIAKGKSLEKVLGHK